MTTQISAVSSGKKALKPARELIPATLPDLAYTPEVARETAHLYEKVSGVIPPIEWPGFAPYIKAINELKRSRNAVVLAHNYMTPEIFHCVADVVGDSLQLAREAAKSDADIIVQGGVHFMAETSKLLNPDKMVLIPTPAPAARSPPRSPAPTCARCARPIPACRSSPTSTPRPR